MAKPAFAHLSMSMNDFMVTLEDTAAHPPEEEDEDFDEFQIEDEDSDEEYVFSNDTIRASPTTVIASVTEYGNVDESSMYATSASEQAQRLRTILEEKGQLSLLRPDLAWSEDLLSLYQFHEKWSIFLSKK